MPVASFLVESVLESKQDIRRRLRDIRQRQAPDTLREHSATIVNRVQALKEYRDAASLLIYVSLPEEVQTDALIAHALQAGKRVCVPVVAPESRDLILSTVTDPATLSGLGPFGIRQPQEDKRQPATAEDLDLVLAPGLAFDRCGNRLGFGKGYFDRLFAHLSPRCRRVGLAFDFQVLDSVPTHPGDLPVHLVVTTSETIVCRR